MKSWFAFPALLLASAHVAAQAVDYTRADVIRTSGAYVLGASVTPLWLDDSVRFVYTSLGKNDRGTVYLVDPARASRRVYFDQNRMAADPHHPRRHDPRPGALPVLLPGRQREGNRAPVAQQGLSLRSRQLQVHGPGQHRLGAGEDDQGWPVVGEPFAGQEVGRLPMALQLVPASRGAVRFGRRRCRRTRRSAPAPTRPNDAVQGAARGGAAGVIARAQRFDSAPPGIDRAHQ